MPSCCETWSVPRKRSVVLIQDQSSEPSGSQAARIREDPRGASRPPGRSRHSVLARSSSGSVPHLDGSSSGASRALRTKTITPMGSASCWATPSATSSEAGTRGSRPASPGHGSGVALVSDDGAESGRSDRAARARPAEGLTGLRARPQRLRPIRTGRTLQALNRGRGSASGPRTAGAADGVRPRSDQVQSSRPGTARWPRGTRPEASHSAECALVGARNAPA